MCNKIVIKIFLTVLIFVFSHKNFGACILEFEDFSFKCPKGFRTFEDEDICATYPSTPCPDLLLLSKDYKIIPKSNTINDDEPYLDFFDNNCKYSIEDITETNKQNITVKLELVFKNLKKPYKLWLYASFDKPVKNIEKKIDCWSKRSGATILVNLTEIAINEKRRRKFVIKLDGDLKYYFCRFIDAGEIKPAFSNKVIASMNATNIFRILIDEDYSACASTVIDNNNLYYNPTVYFTSIDNVDMRKGEDIARRRYTSKSCKYHQVNSTTFCPDDRNLLYYFPQTMIGSTTISSPVCFDENAIPFNRRCIGDGLSIPYWEETFPCNHGVKSQITHFLENVNLTGITEYDLTNITRSLSDVSKIKSVDLSLISNILQKTSISNFKEIFEIADKIFKTDVKAFNVSTSSKNKFLESVELFVENLGKNTKNITVIYPSIAFFIQQPFLEAEEFEAPLNNVAIKLPSTFLNSLNLSASEKNDFALSVISYKNSDFFPAHQNKSITDVVDVVINIPIETFKEPLSIFIKPQIKSTNVSCVFWNIHKESWDDFGIETSSPLDDGSVECKTNHLTRFSLLIVSHDIIDEHKIPFFFMAFWTLESIVSFVGVCTILIMACIMPKVWRVKRRKTIHLSISIALEILVLWIAEFFPGLTQGVPCIILGVTIHYIVLVKNILMYLIAKVEYDKFMSALENSTKRNPCFSYSDIFTVWIIPAGVIAIAIVSSKELYEVEANMCTPKGALFIYFELAPVTILMLINMSIYVIIVIKLAFIESKNDLHSKRQLLQAILLWFMFGICWIFGVLCNMLKSGDFRTVFYYIHGFIAPLQGIVIYIFSVLLVTKRNKCI
nr:uncharacterized protein LOC111421864 [Onthophagus taurus]